MTDDNIPYIEKYRPKEFNEIIGIKDLDRFEEMIKTPKEIPNLLFHGPQGTGKTSLAKVIVSKLKPVDVLRINGSDTTGVDTVRDKVYNFISSMSSTDKPKIVWIEEFDFMSVNAFAALRSMIEDFIKNARFICTCNYLYKVPAPIQSRFSKFEFNRPNDVGIYNRVRGICDMEGINVKEDVLIRLIRLCKGDMREIINNVQQLSSNPQKIIMVTDLEVAHTLAKEVFQFIKDRNWTYIRRELPKQNPDYNNLLVELDELFFNSDLSNKIKAEVNDIVAHGQYEMSLSFDDSICFSAICYRIIKKISELKEE